MVAVATTVYTPPSVVSTDTWVEIPPEIVNVLSLPSSLTAASMPDPLPSSI